jgi:hypothetical protein
VPRLSELPTLLNRSVYDLNEANDYLQPAGLGFYHSGVQVGSSEYTFAGGSGIFSHSPREGELKHGLREWHKLASRQIVI